MVAEKKAAGELVPFFKQQRFTFLCCYDYMLAIVENRSQHRRGNGTPALIFTSPHSFESWQVESLRTERTNSIHFTSTLLYLSLPTQHSRINVAYFFTADSTNRSKLGSTDTSMQTACLEKRLNDAHLQRRLSRTLAPCFDPRPPHYQRSSLSASCLKLTVWISDTLMSNSNLPSSPSIYSRTRGQR